MLFGGGGLKGAKRWWEGVRWKNLCSQRYFCKKNWGICSFPYFFCIFAWKVFPSDFLSDDFSTCRSSTRIPRQFELQITNFFKKRKETDFVVFILAFNELQVCTTGKSTWVFFLYSWKGCKKLVFSCFYFLFLERKCEWVVQINVVLHDAFCCIVK